MRRDPCPLAPQSCGEPGKPVNEHLKLESEDPFLQMTPVIGAEPGSVVGGVVRSGLTLAGFGIAGGSFADLIGSRYMESMLYEVSAMAPMTHLAQALGLLAAAALAA